MGPLLGDELLGDEGLVTSSHGRGTWCVRQTPHQSVRRSTRSGSISEVAPLRTHVQARPQPHGPRDRVWLQQQKCSKVRNSTPHTAFRAS